MAEFPPEKAPEKQDQSAKKLFTISLDQEQLFQKTLEDPHFVQWLKMKISKEDIGMKADYELCTLP